MLGQSPEPVPEVAPSRIPPPGPGEDGPFRQGELGVDDEFRVKLLLVAQARAGRAGPIGGVEGEDAGFQLLQHAPVLRTSELFREKLLFPGVGVEDPHEPLAPQEGQLHRLRDPGPFLLLQHHPVNHQVNVVLLVLFQVEVLRLLQEVDHPVHPHPGVALLQELGEELAVLSFPSPHQGGHEDGPGPGGLGQEAVGDLAGGLLLNGAAALGAVGGSHPGEEEAEVVVDLRHRAHGGAGVVAGGLLVNGDGRGKPLNALHLRLVHHPQELPGVAGEAFHVTPLPLGVDGVKGQGALPRARDPGDDDELPPRELQADVFEVVLPCAPDDDAVHPWKYTTPPGKGHGPGPWGSCQAGPNPGRPGERGAWVWGLAPA